MMSGVCLMLLGCVLFNDSPRILLSRLFLEPGISTQPLLYYMALALIAAGLLVCAIATLGCWATRDSKSNCLMVSYVFFLIILLLAETSFGTVASLCPQVIGVASDRDQMVAGLMNNYGVPGRSQYTAAVDLAQTLLECCGMQSGSDYDGSKWRRREQEFKHDLRVPRSCCFLSNTNDETSFLDPKPVNSSLCQAKTNSRYQYGRHVKGCVDKLNSWFKDHVTIFLTIGLALIIIQLSVLLCALLVCLKKRKQSEVPPSAVSADRPQSLKKHRRSEKNQTPLPERKNDGLASMTIRDNGVTLGKTFQVDSRDVLVNSKSVSHHLKNSNLNEESGQFRERDSPIPLPLVLRNEHFQRFDEYKSKQNVNSIKRNSSITAKYNHYNEGANVYFTPHYDTTGRNRIFSGDSDDYKLNGDLKDYFGKSDKCGADNNSYDNFQDT